MLALWDGEKEDTVSSLSSVNQTTTEMTHQHFVDQIWDNVHPAEDHLEWQHHRSTSMFDLFPALMPASHSLVVSLVRWSFLASIQSPTELNVFSFQRLGPVVLEWAFLRKKFGNGELRNWPYLGFATGRHGPRAIASAYLKFVTFPGKRPMHFSSLLGTLWRVMYPCLQSSPKEHYEKQSAKASIKFYLYRFSFIKNHVITLAVSVVTARRHRLRVFAIESLPHQLATQQTFLDTKKGNKICSISC